MNLSRTGRIMELKGKKRKTLAILGRDVITMTVGKGSNVY
jgi:hypothetical protein